MKSLLTVLAIYSLLLSCAQEPSSHTTVKLENLNYQPQMVAPSIISKEHFEGHASITPDGKQMYYAVYTNDHSYSTIVYSEKVNDEWTEPKIAPFSGQYSDGSPALSPDGQKLFFSSRRPVEGIAMNSNNDLWYVVREENAWSTPMPIEQVNTQYNEFSPSVDESGNLYFCSKRPNGIGDMDIYYAAYDNGSYQTPQLLDTTINSVYQEGNVGISPDGNLLFVMVQHKPGDFGYDDIHYARKIDGRWSQLANLGSIVNTTTYDFSPKVSPDGKTLYFSSRLSRPYNSLEAPYTFKSFQQHLQSPLNGLGNIYQISIKDLQLK